MSLSLRLPIMTARLELREFRATDEGAVFAYASDPRVTRYMLYGPRDLPNTRQYLARVIGYQSSVPRRVWELAVVHSRDRELIGACDITMMDDREGDLGYMLARKFWGAGYATELATALISAAFEGLALHRVYSTVAVENQRSIRVLEKAGMRWEGTFRRYANAKGRPWDCHMYAVSRAEWHARQAQRVYGRFIG